MKWILIAISSHFVWALGNIGDKLVVTKAVKNPYIYAVWSFLTGIFVMLMIPFCGFYIPTVLQFLLIFIATAFEFAAMFPYVKAMQTEDVTRINILWAMIPLFSLIMGYVFVDESLSSNQFIAFFILICGIIFSSLKFGKNSIKFSGAFWLMFFSCIGFSAYGTIVRYVSQEIGFLNVFFYTHVIGAFLAFSLFVFKKVRTVNRVELSPLSLKTLLLIIFVSLIGVGGTFLNVWALSLGKAALVYAMEGFQAIFVFILVIVFALFIKVDLREDLDKRNVVLKICALLINLAGIVILNL